MYRTNGTHDYVFLMNFTVAPVGVPLDRAHYHDMLKDRPCGESAELGPYGVAVLRRPV